MRIRVDIRTPREARGLTQEELARAVGCAPSTISAIERGSNYGRVELLAKISQVLNTPIGEIIRIDGGARKCG